jgi:hypothetical protein
VAEEARFADDFDHGAAQALGRLVEQVIDQPHMRKAFRADPTGTAEKAGVTVDEKTERLILTLAGLTSSELGLLTELNRTFIQEGLYVDTANPASPLFVY